MYAAAHWVGGGFCEKHHAVEKDYTHLDWNAVLDITAKVAVYWLGTPGEVRIATCAMARRLCEDFQQPWDNLNRMQEAALKISKDVSMKRAAEDTAVDYDTLFEGVGDEPSSREEEDARWDVDLGTRDHFYTICQDSQLWVNSGFTDLKYGLATFQQIDCVRDTAKEGTFYWLGGLFVIAVFNMILLLAQLGTTHTSVVVSTGTSNATCATPESDPIFKNSYVGNTRNLLMAVFLPPIVIGSIVSYKTWLRLDYVWLRTPIPGKSLGNLIHMLKNGILMKEETYKLLVLGGVMGCIMLFTILMAALTPDPFEGFAYGVVFTAILILTAPFMKIYGQKHSEAFESFYIYHCMGIHALLNLSFLLLKADAYLDEYCGDKTYHLNTNNTLVQDYRLLILTCSIWATVFLWAHRFANAAYMPDYRENFFIRNAMWMCVFFIAVLYGLTAAWLGSETTSLSASELFYVAVGIVAVAVTLRFYTLLFQSWVHRRREDSSLSLVGLVSGGNHGWSCDSAERDDWCTVHSPNTPRARTHAI